MTTASPSPATSIPGLLKTRIMFTGRSNPSLVANLERVDKSNIRRYPAQN